MTSATLDGFSFDRIRLSDSPRHHHQIAEAAGVSTATVDRVLNNRPGVNPATVQKVRDAVAALGGGAPVRGRPRSTSNYRFAFVLPATRRGFFDAVDRVVAQAAGDFRHQHITEVTHRLPVDGQQFAAELMKLSDLDGIALLAPDVPPVKLAINELVRAGVHVVTLFSDVPGSLRETAIGADNRAAGRTAGLLTGRRMPGAPMPCARCCRPPPATPRRSTAASGSSRCSRSGFRACACCAPSSCRSRTTRLTRTCVGPRARRRRRAARRGLQRRAGQLRRGAGARRPGPRRRPRVHRARPAGGAPLDADLRQPRLCAAPGRALRGDHGGARAARAVRRPARRLERGPSADRDRSRSKTWHDNRAHSSGRNRDEEVHQFGRRLRAPRRGGARDGARRAARAQRGSPVRAPPRGQAGPGGAGRRRRLGPRAAAHRLRGPGHARRRLPGTGVHGAPCPTRSPPRRAMSRPARACC